MNNPTEVLATGWGTLAALCVFIVASVWLGTVAQKAISRGQFLTSFFLGNRGLGAWTLALTATVQSGGTFMGYPAFVYTYGWATALWICGYMIVPITGFGVVAKRVAQLSRKLQAITVPDLFRERFQSPTLGLVSSLLILFFMTFMMVAQFKAGALIMKVSYPGSRTLAVNEETPYQLDDAALNALMIQKVPAAVLDKLRGSEAAPVPRSFASESELKEHLQKLLTGSEFKLHGKSVLDTVRPTDWLYFIGLGVFATTVIGYTIIGGFLAAVWTDLFQSVLMFVGVLLLLPLTMGLVSSAAKAYYPDPAQWQNVNTLEVATRLAADRVGDDFVSPPGLPRFDESAGANRTFLPLSLAFSLFCVWVFSGMASPASVVRLMATSNTKTIRRSIVLLGGYNLIIYVGLLVICICGRAVLPNLEKPDEIIPSLAIKSTLGLPGGEIISGLILTAPFGAVMATVSSYLMVIASGLVRDVYQRFIHPDANQTAIRRLTFVCMLVVGLIAVAANIRPVRFLQAIVVFSGSSAGAAFVVPTIMACFWRRATARGTLAAMLGGAATSIGLYAAGGLLDDQLLGSGGFHPYFLLGMEPIVWGLLVSMVLGISVSLCTQPPQANFVSSLFDRQDPDPDSQAPLPRSAPAAPA